MTRPNNIPLLGLCAIAALALALWLLLADGGGDVHAPEANTPATALDTQAALDVPLSAKAEGDTGTLPLPEKTANLDQTDKRGFEETTAETEASLAASTKCSMLRCSNCGLIRLFV